MNRFEWNGLRCGDIVFVHHPPLALAAAYRGTVDSVAVVAHRGNEIGVRLDVSGDQNIVWPSWLTVHRAGNERSGSCWRCDELAHLATDESAITEGTS